MKRRNFLILSAIGSLGLALGSHRYRAYKYPLKFQACSSFPTTRSSSQLRFVAVGDVGTGDRDQYAVA
ncbi:MAG: metallophosphoesterase, partial [Waterburya sp.]